MGNKQFFLILNNSVEKLKAYLIDTKSFAIALSGGCDSSVLLGLARDLKCDVQAFIVQTEFQRTQDIIDAVDLCQNLNVPCTVLRYSFKNAVGIDISDAQLCYHCKHEMFLRICDAATKSGYKIVMDGTNADDDPVNRPGFKALAEFNIVSPFRKFNIGKQEIRELGRTLNIPQADKSNFACLAIEQRS